MKWTSAAVMRAGSATDAPGVAPAVGTGDGVMDDDDVCCIAELHAQTNRTLAVAAREVILDIRLATFYSP